MACRLNFEEGKHLALAGTIQFATAIQSAKRLLAASYPSLAVPQSRPLSPGGFLPDLARSLLTFTVHSGGD